MFASIYWANLEHNNIFVGTIKVRNFPMLQHRKVSSQLGSRRTAVGDS